MRITGHIISITLLLLTAISAQAGGDKTDRQRYIDQWKTVAQDQMREHGIPASIILAQGILESGDGKSMLSTEGNNHFGIKCHGWPGPGVYKDDDQKNECFRKYDSARESYEDHSDFLKKSRYQFLYQLETTDYKGWANGLKKAGYATDPRYADRLIKLIEENQLDLFDQQVSGEVLVISSPQKQKYEHKKHSNSSDVQEIDLRDLRDIQVHQNGIKYIIAKKGDDIRTIAKALDMADWQIKKYNELGSGTDFKEGETGFIQPKRNKAKSLYHTVEDEETLADISQRYGVKLSRLEKYNSMDRTETLKTGQRIHLRAVKK